MYQTVSVSFENSS